MMEDCRIRRSEFIGVPPVYTGVVFLLSWIYLLFYAQTAGIEAAAPVSLMSGPYLVSALVMSLTLLAISFAPFGRVEFLTASFAKIAAPFSMVVGTVVLMADPPSYLAVVFIWVGGILTGVGSGVMAQQWIVAYRRVGLGVALGSFPTLMAMSVGMCVTLMYLPGNALRVATVVSPVVSGVLFHLVRLEPWPRDELGCSSKDRPLNYLTLLFPIAVFYMSSGFLDFFFIVERLHICFLCACGICSYRSERGCRFSYGAVWFCVGIRRSRVLSCGSSRSVYCFGRCRTFGSVHLYR